MSWAQRKEDSLHNNSHRKLETKVAKRRPSKQKSRQNGWIRGADYETGRQALSVRDREQSRSSIDERATLRMSAQRLLGWYDTLLRAAERNNKNGLSQGIKRQAFKLLALVRQLDQCAPSELPRFRARLAVSMRTYQKLSRMQERMRTNDATGYDMAEKYGSGLAESTVLNVATAGFSEMAQTVYGAFSGAVSGAKSSVERQQKEDGDVDLLELAFDTIVSGGCGAIAAQSPGLPHQQAMISEACAQTIKQVVKDPIVTMEAPPISTTKPEKKAVD